MKTISLSIEELIYSFYSEGLFEQGNSLKQIYFNEISDENMDLLLQISCRTLLAKDLLVYENHKFELVVELKSMISTLNFSEKSLKASRHAAGAKEESVSYHFTETGFLKHALLYDDQVHRFETLGMEELLGDLIRFFQLEKRSDSLAHLITTEELEGMLAYVAENNRQFDSIQIREELTPFYQVLEKTSGQLNTLLLFEFDENKEPHVKDLALLTNDVEGNWMLLQQEEAYKLVKGSSELLKAFVTECSSHKKTEEKESV